MPAASGGSKLSKRERLLYTGGALVVLAPLWLIDSMSIRAIGGACIGVIYLIVTRAAIRRGAARTGR